MKINDRDQWYIGILMGFVIGLLVIAFMAHLGV